jgi:hypothetical protein
MRMLWLPFCCLLLAMSNGLADSDRDRDGGINPLNVMKGMPNPMNLFNSSDRRRADGPPRRPPPPRFPPGHPYAPPAAYQRPIAPTAPFYPGQPVRPMTPPAPQYLSPRGETITPQPPQATSPYSASPPGSVETSTRGREDTDPAQPAYRFRPMTPVESESATPPAAPYEQSIRREPNAAPPAEETAAPPPGISPAPRESSQEVPMVNGQPAIFRPMHLGVEDPLTE